MNYLSRLAGGLAHAALRGMTARSMLLRLAEKRRRSMVLVYHRLCHECHDPPGVVRPLPIAIFKQQLHTLAEVGDIVPLAMLLESDVSSHRLRFAITFDDDDPSHVVHALPTLQQAGIPATFFVSGRALHGVGAYWWDVLDESLRLVGFEQTASLLRTELNIAFHDVAAMASVLEHSPISSSLHQVLPGDGRSRQFEGSDIKALASAGMTIGFHTVRHPVMTALSDLDLARALTEGQSEIASLVNAPVALFAYPYGRADLRVARAAEHAGYRAAFVSGGRPIGDPRDSHLLPRWDPGFLTGQDFLAALAARLHRQPLARHYRKTLV